MNASSPAKEWDGFLLRFSPEIVELVKACVARMRKRLPGATELVYDNYNALVIGFGATERASDAIFSLAIYPRWVNLFFLQGATLDDPKKLLQGSGSVVASHPSFRPDFDRRPRRSRPDGSSDVPGAEADRSEGLSPDGHQVHFRKAAPAKTMKTLC